MKNEKSASSFLWALFIGVAIGVFSTVVGFMSVSEIKFALTKNNVVKVIRLDYEKKQKELDQSYIKTEKTPEQKLIEQVTQELKK